ncbi:helix-turn-helix transcriptional regulator [Actinomycetospora endophytica]|uniref:Helix-turn-helix transcriptional regulator n=1 Tax=Actinomycetospora endophytica TaxID=2291215 RepID=A0ABS8PBA1_9PSEU|nr:helix-turn-helix domain-containing protein [Actinomycetospora endophytica]MCD2194795.1 helix-turn-helix transcriptional regulator [Actinomycetospora endophytica]
MSWLDLDTGNCSVQRALDVIGDRWSLLILRETFNGVRRFDDLAGHLAISESVLSRRLRSLVEAGVLERSAYRAAGQRTRHQYRLTERGLDLLPVLTSLMEWGDRHLADEAGVAWEVHHADCGHRVETVVRCPAHEQTLGPLDTSTAAGPGACARPA